MYFHLLFLFSLIMFASIIIGWGAEIIAVHLSAGIALAILAWLQTSPEFAVEATIAWHRDSELVLANLTGSLRLLMGLGWPMIFFVHWFSSKKKFRWNVIRDFHIELPQTFSVEAGGLLFSVIYFSLIWLKGTWSANDGIVLCGLYVFYFWMLILQRKSSAQLQEAEHGDDAPPLVKKILTYPKSVHWIAAMSIFAVGGVILFFVVHPFIDSLKIIAQKFGMSEFVFVQWVAPIASEFPEKITAFNWARKASRVPMAMINMLSSIVSQWTLMAGLVPLVYSLSAGEWTAIHFSEFQRTEVLLTISQSLLAVLFLSDLRISAIEITGIFVLWLVQFILPNSREELLYVYWSWIGFEFIKILLNPDRLVVWKVWRKLLFGRAR